VAGCDIVVVDDDGREVRPGQGGELMIAGAMVVPGYWDNPAADQITFLDAPLPRNPNGKILKTTLRDLLLAERSGQ